MLHWLTAKHHLIVTHEVAIGGSDRAQLANIAARAKEVLGVDEEIVMLMRRWERVREGDGQLVLIVGEPGLGKSRLIEEFHGRLRDTPHTWVEWSCSQLLQNTLLHPLAEWGRMRFSGADRPAQQRIVESETVLAQVKLDPVGNAAGGSKGIPAYYGPHLCYFLAAKHKIARGCRFRPRWT